MPVINLTTAQRIVENAVAERGRTYVYSEHFISCTYSKGGKPACLIGLAMYNWGKENGFENLHNRLSGLISSTQLELDGLGIRITRPARTFMRIAQNTQDNGKSWGDALDAATAFYRARCEMSD